MCKFFRCSLKRCIKTPKRCVQKREMETGKIVMNAFQRTLPIAFREKTSLFISKYWIQHNSSTVCPLTSEGGGDSISVSVNATSCILINITKLIFTCILADKLGYTVSWDKYCNFNICKYEQHYHFNK